MIAATRPMGLITHSKNFLIMHAPMTGFIREIMHEIILNQVWFVNIRVIWQQIRQRTHRPAFLFQLLTKDVLELASEITIKTRPNTQW
jgi:hypothetical protein